MYWVCLYLYSLGAFGLAAVVFEVCDDGEILGWRVVIASFLWPLFTPALLIYAGFAHSRKVDWDAKASFLDSLFPKSKSK